MFRNANGVVPAQSLKRVFGVAGLVAFGLTYMAPIALFTTYGVVAKQTDNHLASAYLAALVAMIFTAISYGSLTRVFTSAGSSYTYTQRVFGGHIGFMTGWALLLDYLLLPLIVFMLNGLYLNAIFPAVPAWVFGAASLLIVLFFNVVGVTVVRSVNFIIVALSILLLLVFAGLAIRLAVANPTGHTPNVFAPLLPGEAGLGPVLAGAAVLVFSFLGFDAVSTMSEEARRPKRDIPRAIIGATVIGGLLYVFASWMGELAVPSWQTFPDVDSAAVPLTADVGGVFLTTMFIVVYVVGNIGAGMAMQMSVSRILFAMGRDGILPKPFAYLHPRFRTPLFAAVVVSLIACVGFFIDLNTAISMVSFGALVAFSMVNLAVIRYFLLPRNGETQQVTFGRLLRYGLLPLLGFIMTVWLWTSLSAITFIVGISWVALGFVYLVFRTRGFRQKPPMMDMAEGESTTVEEIQ